MLTWDGVRAIRSAYDPKEFRTASRELLLEYRSEGARHQAFFPDAAAIRAKARMLPSRHPHLRGVYCWLMGQEDPAVWKVLRNRLH